MIKQGNKTEKEYRALEMESSSSLKEFSLNRRKYRKKYILKEKVEEEESKASVVGRVVETLLFEPDKFDERFYLSSTASAPTGLMLAFVEALYKYTTLATDEEGNITREFKDIAIDAHKESGFKWKLEAVLENFVGSDNEIYYKEIREVRSKGLTVITIEDIQNAEKIVEELKTNEFTAHIFNKFDDKRYQVLIQHQIEGYEVDGEFFKSMMDIVVVDNKERTIQVYDLKIVWAVEGFYVEYYLFRRAYIQAYLYKEACYELKKRWNLDHYEVLNPKFVVGDSINYYNPLIYELNNSDINDAYVGFTHNGRKYPGVKELVVELKWAKETNNWTISRKNYLNMGVINIKG